LDVGQMMSKSATILSKTVNLLLVYFRFSARCDPVAELPQFRGKSFLPFFLMVLTARTVNNSLTEEWAGLLKRTNNSSRASGRCSAGTIMTSVLNIAAGRFAEWRPDAASPSVRGQYAGTFFAVVWRMIIATVVVAAFSLFTTIEPVYADEIVNQAHSNVLKKLRPDIDAKLTRKLKEIDRAKGTKKQKDAARVRAFEKRIESARSDLRIALKTGTKEQQEKAARVVKVLEGYKFSYFGLPPLIREVLDEVIRLRKLAEDKKKKKTASAGKNGVRYDSPTIAGFTLSAAWGEDDPWDAALRYAGEFGGLRVAAGLNRSIAYGGDGGCRAGASASMGLTSFDKDGKFAREENGAVVLREPVVAVDYDFQTQNGYHMLGCSVGGGELRAGFMYQPETRVDERINSINLVGLGLPDQNGSGFFFPAGNITNFYYESKMRSIGFSAGWSKPFYGGKGPLGPMVVVPGVWGYYGHSDTKNWTMGMTNAGFSDFDYNTKTDDDRFGLGVSLELNNVLETAKTGLGDFALVHYLSYSGGIVFHDVDARSTLTITGVGAQTRSGSRSASKTSYTGTLSTGLRAFITNKVGIEIGITGGYESNYPMAQINAEKGLFIDTTQVWSASGKAGFWFFF